MSRIPHDFVASDPSQPISIGPVLGHDGFAALVSPTPVWPDFMVGQAQRPAWVVLVDDDPNIRHVIVQELMGDPRTVVVGQAASLREGRKVIKQNEFDVLLLDLHLGDGDGFELLNFVKSARPSAEVIVISVMECEEQILRAFELGATGYLSKSSWFGNYPQAVLQVVNGGAAIAPNVARRLLQRFDRPDEGSRNKSHARDEIERLSVREKEVLRLVSRGYTSAEIASRLLISAMTVNTHVRNIYRKLQVRTRAQAVGFASMRGLF